ncbi:PAS domain-containing sensor histidine kinase [Halorubrum ezzemoulense]|uniref:histidine kinase n=1 Tax=Halorubrum ezzemoulense TaxID=337243 RepID=A0A256JX77_HALEZ|nr:PAS domain-containing sensor histidine kinase [Halorubrum ezzemoulense]OYR73435.1 PAS domain-containing sensor histidine kinase [Halorubrum ezzemoulense]
METPPESVPIDHAESIANALGDGAYVLDADRNRVFVNDRLREVTGFDEAVLHAKHPERLVAEGRWSEEADERYRTAVERVLGAEADDERVQLTTTLDDGSDVTTETRLTPIERGGTVVGAVGVIRDVTARVERERELERLNERLERLAGFISHDLRNPLSVARGYVDLARETGDTEQLAAAESAFGRIESMIDEALVMARDPDAIETEEAAVDLADLAADCLGSGDFGEIPAGADLVVADAGAVTGDPTLLRRAVGNLIGNAFEYGGDAPTVRVGVDDRGLYVADDGPGLPDDERDRAELTDFGVSPGGGTGIGLAIVERVAAAHGWTLEVDESPEGGFRATLVGAEPTG